MADHVLLRFLNVLVTPHIAYNTGEAVRRIIEHTLQNIEAYDRHVISCRHRGIRGTPMKSDKPSPPKTAAAQLLTSFDRIAGDELPTRHTW